MAQLLQDVWLEWHRYTYDGKLAALLLAALLYLWFTGKRRKQGALLLYTTFMTFCCILPPTAALLWIYQTRFYDYRWIWSMVPQTAVTAYGIVLFLTECRTNDRDSVWRMGAPVTALLLAALLLSGGMGAQAGGRDTQEAEKRRAYEALRCLTEICPDREICLWAPSEILEYAREADAGIKLPYGRNMWDISLNAYAYDIYDEDTTRMYLWMESLEEDGMGALSVGNSSLEMLTLEGSVSHALSVGVNAIMLPGGAGADTLQQMQEMLGTDAQPLGEYYLFACR